MKYREPESRPRDVLEQHLRSGDPEIVCHALVEAAYHDPDWRWVQTVCARLSHHADEDVRQVAATCLGHLARIHGHLDGAEAEEMLTRLMNDPSEHVTDTIPDVRDDFEVFLGRRYLT